MMLLIPLIIWTLNQTASNGGWLQGQMLDTMDMHVSMVSNVPISVEVLTQNQYSLFILNMKWNAYVIAPLRKNLDRIGLTWLGNYINIPKPTYSVVEQYNSTGANNSIDFYFTNSTGCASYVYVVFAQPNAEGAFTPFALKPNVTATQDLTPLTGVCKT